MSDLRDVTIDELFSWREDLGVKARAILGNRACVNQITYDQIKARCDRVEQPRGMWDSFRRITDLEINVNESVPNGVVRPRKFVHREDEKTV